jgi:hypothetical protein
MLPTCREKTTKGKGGSQSSSTTSHDNDPLPTTRRHRVDTKCHGEDEDPSGVCLTLQSKQTTGGGMAQRRDHRPTTFKKVEQRSTTMTKSDQQGKAPPCNQETPGQHRRVARSPRPPTPAPPPTRLFIYLQVEKHYSFAPKPPLSLSLSLSFPSPSQVGPLPPPRRRHCRRRVR